MKRFLTLVAVGAALLFSGYVYAADLSGLAPVSNKAPAAPVTWSGWYVGPQIGYGWSGDTPAVTDSAVSGVSSGCSSYNWWCKKQFTKSYNTALSSLNGLPTQGDLRSDGGMIGGVAGYDVQMQSWVLGIRGNLNWSSLHGAATFGGSQLTHTMPWLGELNGRVGYLVLPNVLAFAEGGLAVARFDTTLSGVGSCGTGITCPTGSVGGVKAGWNVGGGVEAKVAPHARAFVSANYAKFADDTIPVSGGILNGGYASNVTVKNAVTSVMVGVVFAQY
jgi:outer membrane immunogenic protein